MQWRFRAACVALALVLGLRIDAQAQQDSASPAKAPEKGQTAPDSAKPAAPKVKSKKSSSPLKTRIPPMEKLTSSPSQVEYATFGAGCFWHVEATFERLPGVISAVSGYAGGSVRYPSYEMVHEGDTGHAEVVMVEYDPEVISYEKLLQVFWSHHDPTTPNQQGPDVGTQYRSIILFHNETQRKAALKSYQELVELRAAGKDSLSTRGASWLWNRNPIVTQLVPLKAFYRAEDYHQDYYGGKPRTAASRRRASASKAKKTQPHATRPSPSADETGPAPADDAPAPRQ